MAKRITYHNGRSNKRGIFSAKHNDRNFDTQTAEHIKPSEAEKNIYWHCYQQESPELSFEEVELRYYNEHFKNYLMARNEKSAKQGHRERVQSVADYRKSRKSCLEETLFQVGNKLNSVSREKLNLIIVEYLRWKDENYPNCVTLNVAYHADEQGAGHIHERHIWLAHDQEGREMVNQGEALREMGVPLPDPTKKEGRYNNAKMTFTQKSREKITEIARKWGIEIEDKPKEASKSGQDLLEWQVAQDKIKADTIKAELQKEQEICNDKIIKAEVYLAELAQETEKEKKRANENKVLADTEEIRLANLRLADAEHQQQNIIDENARKQRLQDLENKEKQAKIQLEIITTKTNAERERAEKAKVRAKKRKMIEKIRRNRISQLKNEAETIKAEALNERDIILKPIKEEIIPAIVAVDTAMVQKRGIQNAVVKLWRTVQKAFPSLTQNQEQKSGGR